MKLHRYWIAGFLLLGCGNPDKTGFASLADHQPVVLSIAPEDGLTIDEGKVVEAVFSQPVDIHSITLKSFLITAVPEGTVDVSALWDNVLDEKVTAVEGEYQISEDQRTVRFIAKEPFPAGVRCGVLITPQVLSLDRLPLNQTPGQGPTPFFSSFYAKGQLSQASNITLSSNVAALARPSRLFLNEIFYDAVGSDTEGNLFLELFGEPERNLGDYQIIFVNGSDGKIVDSMKIPKGLKTDPDGFFVIADAITGQSGMTKVAEADWVTNFDPPNGPDCIQLLNPEGQLVDLVGYGSPLVLRAENNLLCYETAAAIDVPSGSSLERSHIDAENRNNSQDWVKNATPSPGAGNVSSSVDLEP